MQYSADDRGKYVKSLIARELDRSGIHALQVLSDAFVAELEGREPEPPLSPAAQAALAKMTGPT
jgi:hypothetical protein